MPKILIVDDDAQIRALLADVLSGTGYPVRLACDGQEALEILRQEGGWVIFLDWHMPQLDGAGVLEHLVDHPALREGNRVILMSATIQFRIAQLNRFAGVVAAFLEKPFDLDEVLALVQAVAARGSAPPWSEAELDPGLRSRAGTRHTRGCAEEARVRGRRERL